MDRRGISSPDRIQKLEIEDWLRQADNLIRQGRYIAADEKLQKVLAVHPTSTVALSYHDRIQFLIRQLSQRVGLTAEAQTEIRAYRDLLLQRKSNLINATLAAARQMIEGGYLKKASEEVKKVLGIDPQNVYATALLQRIAEANQKVASSECSESELQYASLLAESWKSGAPGESQAMILDAMQGSLGIADERRRTLEKDARNALYKRALEEIWATGGLAAFTMTAVEDLRVRYRITQLDQSLIEAAFLKEVRRNRLRGTVLIVDEESGILAELSARLRQHHYAVVAAANFDEAVAAFDAIQVDAVITEVRFGGVHQGYDLFEYVRATAGLQKIPFLFMTTGLDRTSLLIAKRLGIDDVLTKPIDGDLMVATLTGALQRYAAVRVRRNNGDR
jgi:CheY-like chemotaxis protein